MASDFAGLSMMCPGYWKILVLPLSEARNHTGRNNELCQPSRGRYRKRVLMDPGRPVPMTLRPRLSRHTLIVLRSIRAPLKRLRDKINIVAMQRDITAAIALTWEITKTQGRSRCSESCHLERKRLAYWDVPISFCAPDVVLIVRSLIFGENLPSYLMVHFSTVGRVNRKREV